MEDKKLKKGLSYISERTDQLRYSDKNNIEEWLQPISVYYPLEEVKRGQPLAAATYEDIQRIFKDKGISPDDYLHQDKTYAVLCDPSKHNSSLGLSMEYCKDPFEGNSFDPQPLHILGDGKFNVDPSYYNKSHQNNLIANLESIEYLPEFLKDEKNIGKKVFVKGCGNTNSIPGLLTIDTEEAYLANNNIIQIGTISDSFGKDKSDGFASIEIQIEGDDRGPIDATQFELTIGEKEVIIDSKNPIRVFALGEEENTKFEFKLGMRLLQTFDPKKGFIGIRRCDGKTALISFSDLSPDDLNFSSNYTDPEDKAFIEVAKSYSKENPIKVIQLSKYPTTGVNIAECWKELQNSLNDAIKYVAAGVTNPNPGASQEEITQFNIVTSEVTSNTAFAEFIANAVGGSYDIYVSTDMATSYELILQKCHGSYKNKGTAILADIRNPKRQNVIGIYNSGNYDKVIKYGDRAIFTHLGVFDLPEGAKPLTPGQQYYLGSCGTVTEIPQSYYNTVVKIGSAETDKRLITMCDDAREFWDGELPIGFMKPTVKGNAEYGYLPMDGKTTVKISEYEKLYQVLKDCMPGLIDNTDGTFTLPKLIYGITYNAGTEEKEELRNEVAQVKAVAHGVYQKDVPHPYIRKVFDEGIDGDEINNHKVVSLPNIDVTPLVTSYGIIGDNTAFFNAGDVEVKVFVDCRKDVQQGRKWVEVRPGFKNFNNLEYYGYEWHIEKTHENTIKNPNGTWEIIFENEFEDTNNKLHGYGPCIESSPFQPAVSISKMPLQIVVYRHDMWERQFDLQGVFQDLVSQNIISVIEGGATTQAVSGKAVEDYINEGVNTKLLTITDGKIKISNLTESIIEPKDVDKKAGLRINGTVELDSKEVGNTLEHFVIANKNKLLGFYYKNPNTKALEDLEPEALAKLQEENFKDGDFIPKKFLASHENEKVANLDHSGIKNGPHGIINDGIEGNLHAVTLNTLKVGKPSIDYNAATASSVAPIYNAKIPYIYTDNSIQNINDYRIDLPRTLLFDVQDTESKNNTPIIEVGKDGSNTDIELKKSKYSQIFKFGNQNIKLEYDFSGEKPSFSVYGNDHPLLFDAGSTIQVKALNKEFTNAFTNIEFDNEDIFLKAHIDAGHTDEHKDALPSLPLKQNALQALSIMPTAAFHYLREESNVKRWFGIITERIAEAKTKITEKGINGKLGFFDAQGNFDNEKFDNDLSYTFTPEEVNSVKEYLNFITNDNDSAQNVLSSLGVLLEAAKETQMRLLPNEASIYGADASTIPGERASLDNKAPDYATNTPTHLGLNRLVKALCAEVFLDADPEDIAEGSGEGRPASYSRLDQVCQAIYGDKTDINPHDENKGTNIDLKSELGKTYPAEAAENIRESGYTVTKDNVSYLDNGKSQYAEDEWFKSKELSADKEADRNLGITASKYNGLNDAVNRIVVKLNKLTKEIHDEDNINAPASALNRIRDNVETLIHEVYDIDDYKDEENGTPFVKSNLSRIDEIGKDLHSGTFTLAGNKNIGEENQSNSLIEDATDVGEWSTSKRKFNGKALGLYKTKTPTGKEEANTLTEITLKVPTSIQDLSQYANILDILIDYIAGETNNILRENNPNEASFVERRKSENLTQRIKQLEESLDFVTKRFKDGKDLEKVEARNDNYANIKDIDSFIDFISGFLGIKSQENESGDITWIGPNLKTGNWHKFLVGNKEAYTKPDNNSQVENNFYGNIVDLAAEAEKDDKYQSILDKVLGTKYKPDISKPDLGKTNLTTELDRLNRMFYGTTEISEGETSKTVYDPSSSDPGEENLSVEGFTSDVMGTLYGALYSMPDVYKNDSTTISLEKHGIFDKDSEARYLLKDDALSNGRKSTVYDITSSMSTEISLPAILEGTQRTSAIEKSSAANRRWNRFEAIEDQLVALRIMALGPLAKTEKASEEKITLSPASFISRSTNVVVEQTPYINLNEAHLDSGLGELYNNIPANYTHKITSIGEHEVILKLNSAGNGFENSSALGIAALTYNLAQQNFSAIKALNDMLFVRKASVSGNIAEDCFWKQFTSLRDDFTAKVASNDTAHNNFTQRIEALEAAGTASTTDFTGIKNKLGVKKDEDSKDLVWLEQEDHGYNESLYGMHQNLNAHVGEWTIKEPAVEGTVCKHIEALEAEVGAHTGEGNNSLNSRVKALERVDTNQETKNTEFRTVFGNKFYTGETRIESTVTSELERLDTRIDNLKLGTPDDKESSTLWAKANNTATDLSELSTKVTNACLGEKIDSQYTENDTVWSKIKELDDAVGKEATTTPEATGLIKKVTDLQNTTGLNNQYSKINIEKDSNDNKIIKYKLSGEGLPSITEDAINIELTKAILVLQKEIDELYTGSNITIEGASISNIGGIGVRPVVKESHTQLIPNKYTSLWESVGCLYDEVCDLKAKLPEVVYNDIVNDLNKKLTTIGTGNNILNIESIKKATTNNKLVINFSEGSISYKDPSNLTTTLPVSFEIEIPSRLLDTNDTDLINQVFNTSYNSKVNSITIETQDTVSELAANAHMIFRNKVEDPASIEKDDKFTGWKLIAPGLIKGTSHIIDLSNFTVKYKSGDPNIDDEKLLSYDLPLTKDNIKFYAEASGTIISLNN